MIKKKVNNCKVAQEHSANSAEFMILYKENNYCLISHSFCRRSYLKDIMGYCYYLMYEIFSFENVYESEKRALKYNRLFLLSEKWDLFIHEINLVDNIIVCSIVKFIRMMLKFVDHFDLEHSFLFLCILVIMGCCCCSKEHFVTYYYQYIKNTLWVLKRRISIHFLNRELPVSRMILCKICSDMMIIISREWLLLRDEHLQ